MDKFFYECEGGIRPETENETPNNLEEYCGGKIPAIDLQQSDFIFLQRLEY